MASAVPKVTVVLCTLLVTCALFWLRRQEGEGEMDAIMRIYETALANTYN